MTSIRWIVFLAAVLSAMLGLLGFSPTAMADDMLYELRTDARVDEQLFLLRQLEVLHGQMPIPDIDREKTAGELMTLRHELDRVKEYASTKQMDKRLLALYDDSIKLTDHYSELLMDLGAIDRDFSRKRTRQSVDHSADGFVKGFQAGGGLAVAGVEPITATVIAGSLFAKSSLDGYLNRQELDDENSQALQCRFQQFLNEQSRLVGRIEVQASVLGEKFGWAAKEEGFDATPEESQTFLDAITNGNYALLRQQLDRYKQLRPRDPFVFSGSGELYALESAQVTDSQGDKARIRQLELAVADCLRAAELIPASKFHDDLRAEYLLQAASYAWLAAYWSSQQTVRPLQLANAALHFRPRDADGRIDYYRALALARMGDHETARTLLQKWGSVHGEDADFHYNLACLRCLAGDPQSAMQHLNQSWNLGNRDVRYLKQDRDLRVVRETCVEFQQLITPAWKGEISYGQFWNDFTVTNESSFSLTNVVIETNWKGPDGTEFKEVYWFDSIVAGDSGRVSGALDQASDDVDHPPQVETRITADELRGIIPTGIKDLVGHYTGIDTLMNVDASDVSTSKVAQLVVSQAADDRAQLQFSIGESVVSFVMEPLRDSSAPMAGALGGGELGRVWFDRKQAYGWYQSPADVVNEERHVFWLER